MDGNGQTKPVSQWPDQVRANADVFEPSGQEDEQAAGGSKLGIPEAWVDLPVNGEKRSVETRK